MNMLYKEVPAMNSETNKKVKDIVWSTLDKKCTVRNVPYSKVDAEGEEFISVGVSLKLELIKELMLQDEIPYDVDFSDIADLNFSN